MINENVRDVLLKKRASLLARRKENLAEAQELCSASEPDPADVAADVTNARVLERLGDDEFVQLQRIGRALERLEDGTYGQCVVCGGQIPLQRIAAMPEADRCVTCTNSH